MADPIALSLKKLFSAFALINEALTTDLLPAFVVQTQVNELCRAFSQAYPSVRVLLIPKPLGNYLAFTFVNSSVYTLYSTIKKADFLVGIGKTVEDAEKGKDEITEQDQSFVLYAETPEDGRYQFIVRSTEQEPVLSAQIIAFIPPSELGVKLLTLLIPDTPADLVTFEKSLLMISLLFDSETRKYGLLGRFNPLFGV